MEAIQVNIAVTLRADESLERLLANFMGCKPAKQTAALAKAMEAEKITVTKAEPAPAQPAEPAKAAEPEKPQEEKFTEVEVREAIDRARKRIEGTDQKAEPYKLYHKALTERFKAIAKELAGVKPSELPDSETRGRFIAECDALIIGEDGKIDTDMPC